MAGPDMKPGKASSDRLVGRVLVTVLLASLVAGILLIPGTAGGQVSGPPISHPIEGWETCTQCHGPSGPVPAPSDHEGYTTNTCLICHEAATPSPTSPATSTPTPLPTPSPTAEPTLTPAPSPTPTPLPEPSPTAEPTLTPAPTLTPTPPPTPSPTADPTITPAPSPSDLCLVCHRMPGLDMTFPNGDAVSLTISSDALRQSVHGDLLVCQDCHRGYQEVPHPAFNVASYRDYAIARYETCKRCHFANYTRTLDSVHFETLSAGNLQAPLCTDCHGAHNASALNSPRSRTALTCAQCHIEIYTTYRESVHGQALVSEENQDVPTCTYCHGVHTIRDPRTSSFRLEIPQLCGSCHADGERMSKYGLSTNVLDTYLHDFHGVTVSLARKQDPDILSYEAVCTDCHGVHNIVSTKSPSSPVIKANLVETCRQCHSGATEDFPSAWLSHYEPSLSRAPLVFLVKMFYRIFIPMVVVGLSVQVALNLWRSAINR